MDPLAHRAILPRHQVLRGQDTLSFSPTYKARMLTNMVFFLRDSSTSSSAASQSSPPSLPPSSAGNQGDQGHPRDWSGGRNGNNNGNNNNSNSKKNRNNRERAEISARQAEDRRRDLHQRPADF